MTVVVIVVFSIADGWNIKKYKLQNFQSKSLFDFFLDKRREEKENHTNKLNLFFISTNQLH